MRVFKILCRCHEIKSPPKQILSLAEMKSPTGDSVSEQSLSHQYRISPSTIQSLPIRKSPLYFRVLFYMIYNSSRPNYVHAMHALKKELLCRSLQDYDWKLSNFGK